jgi:hypothetical protein
MGNAIDITGRRFGRLVIIERAANWRGKTMWRCRCDCGSQLAVQTNSLTSGNTKSCGCLASGLLAERNTTHGMTHTRIYGIWRRMRQRCGDPNCTDYERYGGRGVSVCEEWAESFEAFHTWALANGYQRELTIDRIDADGDYEPRNCRWITLADQNRNKRNNRLISFGGKTKTLAEWSRALGIDHSLLRYRIRHWGVERAFTTPVRGRSA